MQLIKPQEAVWVVGPDTISAGDVALLIETGYTQWGGAVQVLGWVVVYVGDLKEVVLVVIHTQSSRYVVLNSPIRACP